MKFKVTLCASVGSIAMIAATPAIAQDNEGAGDRPPFEDKEIVVTATKQETNLQDTALSIGVVSGEEIAEKGLNDFEDILRQVPGVQVQNFAQGAQVYIRGIGSSIDPSFADPSVALMVDGVYNGRTESVQAGGFDIARVEVARGPQGTLYGRNANGGVINVITNDPVLGEFGATGRFQFGNYDLFRQEASINLPLGETVALRIAGFNEDRDGYIDDGSEDSNKWAIRAKLLIEPSDAFRAVFKAEYFDADELGQNTVPVPGSGTPAGAPFPNLGIFPPPFLTTNFDPVNAPQANFNNGLPCAGMLPDGSFVGSPFIGCGPIPRFPNGWEQRDPGNPWSNNPEHPPGFQKRSIENYSAVIDADLGFATLTVLPSYTVSNNELASSFLFGILTGPYMSVPIKTKYTSLEARLASNGDGPFSYVIGGYYLHSDTTGIQPDPNAVSLEGNPFVLINDPQPAKTLAAFGQFTYDLTDTFRLTGGLRLSQDKNSQEFTFSLPGADQADLQTPSPQTFSDTATQVLYKIGFEVDAGPESLIYGHVSSGFKQGGVNVTAPPVTFDPESLTAFEIGAKNRFLDNRVTLNLAAFYYKYDDYQFSAPQTLGLNGATVGGVAQTNSFFGVVQNAGSTDVFGIEVEGNFRPWRGASISASVNYLDATYGEACLGDNPFVPMAADPSCPAGLVYSLTDRQIQNSPKWSGTASFSQDIDIGTNYLTIGVDTRWSSSYFVTPEQFLPGALQDSYTVTNARVRYTFGEDRFAIGAWVNNIENNAQTTGLFPLYRRFVSAPRTYGLNAEFRF